MTWGHKSIVNISLQWVLCTAKNVISSIKKLIILLVLRLSHYSFVCIKLIYWVAVQIGFFVGIYNIMQNNNLYLNTPPRLFVRFFIIYIIINIIKNINIYYCLWYCDVIQDLCGYCWLQFHLIDYYLMNSIFHHHHIIIIVISMILIQHVK